MAQSSLLKLRERTRRRRQSLHRDTGRGIAAGTRFGLCRGALNEQHGGRTRASEKLRAGGARWRAAVGRLVE